MTDEHSRDLDRTKADHLFVIRTVNGIEVGCRMRVFPCGCVEIVDAVRVERGGIVEVYSRDSMPDFVDALIDEYARVAQVIVPMRNVMSKIELLAAIAERAGADHTH